MSEPLLVPVADSIFDCGILVVCDDRSALGLYRDVLTENGYSVVCEQNPAQAIGLLSHNKRIAVVFIDLAAGPLSLLEKFRAQGLAREGVEYVVVSDERRSPGAAEAAVPPFVECLVKPFNDDRLLTAVSSAYNVARMQRFRLDEMRSLENSLLEFKTRTLAAVSHLIERAQNARNSPAPSNLADITNGRPDASLHVFVEEECRRARVRERIFGPLALSHSGWMLLLVLAEAQLAGIRLTVKSAAYSAGLPLSSALRKINEMCANALMEKSDDPKDARRSFVTLTSGGLSYLAAYLSELAKDPAHLRERASK